MDLLGAARSRLVTIPFVTKSKTLSGSLIPYTSDHDQASSVRMRASLSRVLKFLLFRVFWVGSLLTLTAATMGKWSVVKSVRTLTVASTSFVTQTWSRTDSWPLASPSSLLCRLYQRYVGLRYGVVVCKHEASSAIPHVAPPGRVEVDVSRKNDIVNLGGRCL
jgi:hypothetical protein